METYLADGYTERGYIAALSGLHGALRFTFRPMLPEETDAWTVLIANTKPTDHAKESAKTLAKFIKTWDLKAAGGENVPLRPENIMRLKPAVFRRVLAIVMGQVPSDTDPDGEAGTSDMVGEARAILEGPLGEKQKN